MLRFGLAGLRVKTRDKTEIVVRFCNVSAEVADSKVVPWWDEQDLIREVADAEHDRDWPWDKIAKHCLTGELPDCVGLERSSDRLLLGAMWLDKAEESRREAGKEALHIQRLATAPRNRENVANEPMYGHVGANLICYAVVYSYALGYEGRVILTSLPKAIGFYEHLGFKPTGGHDREGLPEYELPAIEGQKMLRRYGFL